MTLRAYRQALARSFDDLGVYTVLASTSTATTVHELLNSTPNGSGRRYDGRWAYISGGVAVGAGTHVRPAGLVPSTGVLTMARFWDTIPVANDILELTGLFPAVPGLGEDTDYRTLINRALGRLLVEDRLDVTTVADQWTYSLSAYPWLDRMTRVMAVLDPPRATGLPRRETWRPHHWTIDQGAMTLEFDARPYPTSGATFQVKVLRPANTLITGTESSVGLVSDDETAVPSVEEVVTVARMFAFETLLTRSKGRPSGDWSGQFEIAQKEARGLARWDRSQDVQAEPTQRQGAA